MPDETLRQCSIHRNAPAQGGRRAIQQRERAGIVHPSDGQYIGDWKKGEASAQSGYGQRFTDLPARRPNGGNCYACHQIAKQEVSYGTLGPPLLGYGRLRNFADADAKVVYEKIYTTRGLSVLHHASLRRRQDPDRRPDQGSRGAADEPGQPGQQVGSYVRRSTHVQKPTGDHRRHGCVRRGV